MSRRETPQADNRVLVVMVFALRCSFARRIAPFDTVRHGFEQHWNAGQNYWRQWKRRAVLPALPDAPVHDA
jgi:hypothetical protein